VGNPTFTRADGADYRATVTDFEGLIRPVKDGEARFEGARRVENLLTLSEFLNGGGYWIMTAGTTVTANTHTAPDGTLTADTVTYDGSGTSGNYRIYNDATGGLSMPGANYVTSVYLRADTATTVRLYGNVVAGGFITCNLTTSWQRYTISGVGNGVSGPQVLIYSPAGVNTPFSIQVWGTQIENTTGQANQNPSEYVSTNVLSAPYHGASVDGVKYFTYQNGNTVASNVVTEAVGGAIPDATLHGYLAEGARTNKLTYSSTFTNTGSWQTNNLTVTGTSSTSTSGSYDASILTFSSGSNSYLQQYQVVTGATTYTMSFYAKAGNTNDIRLYYYDIDNDYSPADIYVDLLTKAVTVKNGSPVVVVTALNNGWYRIQSTFTNVANNTNGEVGVGFQDTAVAGDTFYVWGAQLETAPFASSYIPTTSASVTRAADALTYPTSGNIQSSAGTAYMEVQINGSSTAVTRTAFMPTDYGNNTIRLFANAVSNGLSQIAYGTGSTVEYYNMQTSNNDRNKYGLSWTSGGTGKRFENGTKFTDTTPVVPTMLTDIKIGYDTTPFNLFGTVRNVHIWKQALSDDYLTRMTTSDTIELNSPPSTSMGTTLNTNPDLTRGLVAHYTFDGPDMDWSSTTAEVRDTSGQGNNGNATTIMTSARSSVPGVVGQGLNFNNVSTSISLPNIASTQQTVCAWVKPRSYATGSEPDWVDAIAYKGTDAENGFFDLSVGGAGARSAASGKVFTSASNPPLNQWSHECGVLDGAGSSLSYYLNGNLIGTPATITGFSVSSSPWYIGKSGEVDPYEYYLDGSLDDVRIYNRALSPAEITRLYGLGAGTHVAQTPPHNPTLDTGLVAHYTFDGPDMDWSSTTSEVRDTSGQGNNGDATSVLSSVPSATPGVMGQALDFKGTGDVATASATAADDNMVNFTTCAWINPANLTASQYAVVKGNVDWGVNIIATTGQIFFTRATTGGYVWSYSNTNISAGNWQHICTVFNGVGTYARIYINGSDKTILSSPSLVGDGSLSDDSAKTIEIGGSNSGYSNLFSGKIDDVRIYSRALSADEVKRLYDMGR
jgi:hypothetical protein